MRPADENLIYKYAILLGEKAFKPIKKDNEVKYLALLRGVTALTRAVSGEKQIYSGNLEILRGIGKPGNFFGKFEIFSGH